MFPSASFNARTIQARNSCVCNSEAYIAVGQLNWDVIRGFFFAKTGFLPQRSLQNLRVNAINEHGYCHLFTNAMQCISLVFVKYCPALDENLEAWVQNITLGNNQVATKFTFCCRFLSLLQRSTYCSVAGGKAEGQACGEGWIYCGHPASKEGRGRSRPQALSHSAGLHFLPVTEPALGVEITVQSKATGEQSAMQWYLSLFLHMGDKCW